MTQARPSQAPETDVTPATDPPAVSPPDESTPTAGAPSPMASAPVPTAADTIGATEPAPGTRVAEPTGTTPSGTDASRPVPPEPAATTPPVSTVTRPESAADARIAQRETALLAALARAEDDRLRLDAAAAARDTFPDQGDGTFLDRQEGLLWTVASEPRQGTDGLLWVDANDYCDRLPLGGRGNWRLPTHPELDGLLQRLDPERYPWGLTLWSADRATGDPNRLWVTNSPLYAPAWSSVARDDTTRRLTHHVVCVSAGGN